MRRNEDRSDAWHYHNKMMLAEDEAHLQRETRFVSFQITLEMMDENEGKTYVTFNRSLSRQLCEHHGTHCEHQTLCRFIHLRDKRLHQELIDAQYHVNRRRPSSAPSSSAVSLRY